MVQLAPVKYYSFGQATTTSVDTYHSIYIPRIETEFVLVSLKQINIVYRADNTGTASGDFVIHGDIVAPLGCINQASASGDSVLHIFNGTATKNRTSGYHYTGNGSEISLVYSKEMLRNNNGAFTLMIKNFTTVVETGATAPNLTITHFDVIVEVSPYEGDKSLK